MGKYSTIGGAGNSVTGLTGSPSLKRATSNDPTLLTKFETESLRKGAKSAFDAIKDYRKKTSEAS
jgi:hypothetical protein